jgi:hypothetical protein
MGLADNPLPWPAVRAGGSGSAAGVGRLPAEEPAG